MGDSKNPSQVAATTSEDREVLLARLANQTANQLLKLQLSEDELELFFRRLQIVDARIKFPKLS